MTQELFGLQAHGIALRLVQSVPQLQLAGMPVPSGPQVPPQVTVLGQSFVANWAGINGPRGFSAGNYEARLYEEGACQITFPNAEGEDGLLHRRRLLIIQAGRMTPLGGNVATYTGGAFRPGDEFIEIYRTSASGAPGKLLFVCAVTKATLDSGNLTVEGNDALWLLKKTRESAAGIFVNSPRDVIEHFSKVKQVVVADDFPQPDSRFSYSGGSVLTTSDGQWKYDNAYDVPSSTNLASTWSASAGSVVRLQNPGGSQQAATIAPAAAVPGTFIQRPDPWLRWEVRFRAANALLGAAGAPYLEIGIGAGGPGTNSARPKAVGWYMQVTLAANSGGNQLPGYITIGNGQGSVIVSGEVVYSQLPNFSPNVWHTAAIEVRDRYVFFYVDGKLIWTLPQWGAVDNTLGSGLQASLGGGTVSGLNPYVSAVGGAGPSPFSVCSIDVDYALLRQKVPGFLRPATPVNLGDYKIGGAPAPGSCLFEVWHFDDAGGPTPVNGPLYGAEFSPARLSQFSGKFATVGCSFAGTIAANVPDWWPSAQNVGAWYNAAWACRASGSMYLTLASYDYRFRFNCDDGARVWVGKTRFGEQLADNWRTHEQTGHTVATSFSPFLKNATGIGTAALTGTLPVEGSTSFTVNVVPAYGYAGTLVRIGNAAPYEYHYITSISGNTINTRDRFARNHNNGEAVVWMNQGILAGLTNGWYPFIFEFFNNPAGLTGGATLQYERSDQPNWFNGVGAGSYLHTVYSMTQKYNPASAHYFPLNEGLWQTAGSPYNDPAGGASASLGSGDGFIGTSRSTLVPGDVCPVFNGGNTSGRTGDSLNSGPLVPSAGWTISALARTTNPSGIQEIIRQDLALALRFNGTNVEVVAWNGSGSVTITATAGVVANAWYHLVATWDGATIRLYVNGSLAASGSFSGQVTNTNNFYFASTSGSSEWFNGAIGHVLLLTQAMSAADVLALFNAVTSPPHIPVSSSGIIDTTQQPLRYVSHYDQLVQYVKDWGYQVTSEPMQLESGEFPGRLRPLVRVGRDTEFVVGSPQVRHPTADTLQDAITAEEVCDALVADAQGLADPTGATQVAAEVFAFAQMFGVPPGATSAIPTHPWLSEEYDQSSDVSFPDMLVQRLYSQLALRGSPWENISMAHRPERQLIDTFPLTGTPAEFNWSPGDGVRLDMPELEIRDLSPRQVLGVQWPLTPAGLGAPAISLRQRPRNFRQVLRDMFRGQLSSQRAYQTQLVMLVSTMGSNNGSGASDGSTSDTFARVGLPNNLADLVSATLVVAYRAGSTTSAYAVAVNGVATSLTVNAAGRYDLTPFLARGDSGGLRFYVQCTGGTGVIEYTVELLVKQ